LAFGSDKNGENGLFWGKPAHDGQLDLASSINFLSSDLPACKFDSVTIPIFGPSFSNAPTHNGTTGDFITKITDNKIITLLDQTSPGWTHQANGWASFQGPNNSEGWPSALTVDHQVMQISSIKRAFDGGLRLMFASVTDDELLSDLWQQTNGAPRPVHSPYFDYQSAQKQLTYITSLVNANSSWMQIVATPSQARAAINSNPPKLAVVLSLEMDSLSLQQIQDLVQQFHVAHVIPIHLANNPNFGGTAIYSDTFNALSNFINGSFYAVTQDKDVNYQLSVPQVLVQTNVPGVASYFDNQNAPAGTYPNYPPNEVNSVGLNKSNLYALMQMGLSARGGAPPYTWSVQSGSVPPGLNLNKSGTISGTATSSGQNFTFTVAVEDSSTPQSPPSTLSFTMVISAKTVSCMEAPNHQLCGNPPVQTCVVPPAKCPPTTCPGTEVLKDGECVPKGGSAH
jgi:hypothetical protein